MYAIIFVRQAVLSGAASIALFNEEAVAIQIRIIYGRWFEQKNAYVQEKDVTAEAFCQTRKLVLLCIAIFPKMGLPYWLSK